MAERPLVVIFRPDTRAGQVYDRRVDGQTLTFKQSDDPLELIDVETGSTWFFLTGQAVDGPLQGAKLAQIPSTSSFWFGWHDWYPETLLYGSQDR